MHTSCALPLGRRDAANEAGLSSDLFDDQESWRFNLHPPWFGKGTHLFFFFFFFPLCVFQQELPTRPHVDPEMPRLVRVEHSPACVWGLECLPSGLRHVDLCWVWKSGFQCGTGTACLLRERMLFHFSHGCQKRKEKSAACLFGHYEGMKSLVFLILF